MSLVSWSVIFKKMSKHNSSVTVHTTHFCKHLQVKGCQYQLPLNFILFGYRHLTQVPKFWYCSIAKSQQPQYLEQPKMHICYLWRVHMIRARLHCDFPQLNLFRVATHILLVCFCSLLAAVLPGISNHACVASCCIKRNHWASISEVNKLCRNVLQFNEIEHTQNNFHYSIATIICFVAPFRLLW